MWCIKISIAISLMNFTTHKNLSWIYQISWSHHWKNCVPYKNQSNATYENNHKFYFIFLPEYHKMLLIKKETPIVYHWICNNKTWYIKFFFFLINKEIEVHRGCTWVAYIKYLWANTKDETPRKNCQISQTEKIPIAQLIIDSRIYLVPDLISSIFYNNFNLDDIFFKEKKKKCPNSYALSTNIQVYDPKLQ